MLQRVLFIASPILFALLLVFTVRAQSLQPLPSNYKIILDNPDLLVMHVHYGPHEFVPMHDHSAYTTLYVYLNDSGVVRIDHEGGREPTVNRPPTHTGAFRISPGVAERHSVTNLDERPSDFLRVEFKRIPSDDIKEAIRGPAPRQLNPGSDTEFSDHALRMDRIVCPHTAVCSVRAESVRSLLVAVLPVDVKTTGGTRSLRAGDVFWLAPNVDASLSPSAQIVRVSILYP